MLDGTNEITKEIMKMIKSNGTFNSKIAISQKPFQITITIAVIRGITVRRMLDGLLMQPKKQRPMTTYQN
jgi:hypothetical protein